MASSRETADIADKPMVLNIEQTEDQKVYPAVDYAGASSKIDPAEIALVRKLDLRIMPALWAMYFLNYVSPHRLFSSLAFSYQ